MTLILQTIRVLVARMNKLLGVEAANAVVQPLLKIWDDAGDKNVLRKYVLSILTNVSGVVRAEDAKLLYPVVQPMLDVATSGGESWCVPILPYVTSLLRPESADVSNVTNTSFRSSQGPKTSTSLTTH